jgi:DNA ligase-1
MAFKPLLAVIDDPKKSPDFFGGLRYPLMVSPKLDGIRCIVKEHETLSRTGKVLPSEQVQREFCMLNHTDGELIAGDICHPEVYNITNSHVMSRNKPTDMSYHTFDWTHPDWLEKPFYQRVEELRRQIAPWDVLQYVAHELVENLDDLLEYEQRQLELGFEGIMMRDPMGRYKNGRSTYKEGILYKLKRFTDGEALIIGYVQRQENHNEQTRDELGFAKRSDHKANKVPVDMVGKFLVGNPDDPDEIAPGSFTHEQLREMWLNADKYIGKAYVKFRHFEHGVKSRLRLPRAVGLRHPMDM